MAKFEYVSFLKKQAHAFFSKKIQANGFNAVVYSGRDERVPDIFLTLLQKAQEYFVRTCPSFFSVVHCMYFVGNFMLWRQLSSLNALVLQIFFFFENSRWPVIGPPFSSMQIFQLVKNLQKKLVFLIANEILFQFIIHKIFKFKKKM